MHASAELKNDPRLREYSIDIRRSVIAGREQTQQNNEIHRLSLSLSCSLFRIDSNVFHLHILSLSLSHYYVRYRLLLVRFVGLFSIHSVCCTFHSRFSSSFHSCSTSLSFVRSHCSPPCNFSATVSFDTFNFISVSVRIQFIRSL